MSRNALIYLVGICSFIGLGAYALMQELDRNELEISGSISGVIQATPQVGGAIVKTDVAYLLLIEPETKRIAATGMINPFVPPMAFSVGQADALNGQTLSGNYQLLILTDKNADPNLPGPGELIGPLSPTYSLGKTGVEYVLDRFFEGFPPELEGGVQDSAETSISGTVTIAPELRSQVEPGDRLIVLLFDPKMGRPAAFRILAGFREPQSFHIGAADAMGGGALTGPYQLRIVTDKNNQPFQSAPGEVIGRSSELIPLGTHGMEFVLDQPYVR